MTRRSAIRRLVLLASTPQLLSMVAQATPNGVDKPDVVFDVPGDGLSDVHNQLQSAIDRCSKTGDTLHLPAGIYRIEAPVFVRNGTSISGAGHQTIILPNFKKPFNRVITSNPNELTQNVSLQHFRVIRTPMNAQHGMLFGGINGLVIEGITIEGFSPLFMSGALGVSAFDGFAKIQSQNILIRGCRFIRTNNFGVAFGNCKNGIITDCQFEDCYREAIGFEAWGDGTTMAGANSYKSLGIVEDCHAFNNRLFMSDDSSNHVRGYRGPAIFVGASSSKGLCRDCSIISNQVVFSKTSVLGSYNGVAVFGGPDLATENIRVESNYLKGPFDAHIQIGMDGYKTNKISVIDNIFSLGEVSYSGDEIPSGIRVRNASGVVLKGNHFVPLAPTKL